MSDFAKRLEEANKVIAGHEKHKEKMAKDLDEKNILLEEQTAAYQKVSMSVILS